MLTDKAIKAAKPKDKPYKLSDSHGMYLEVTPKGAKYFRLKFRLHGKESRISLGVYPAVSLQEAREMAAEKRKAISTGKHPRKAESSSSVMFEALALEWHKLRSPLWTPKYSTTVLSRLERDVFPLIGNRPVDTIDIQDVLKVVRSIESRGATDAAKDTLGAMSQVFRYGAVIGKVAMNPAAGLSGALQARQVKHHAYLKAKELPEFMKKLEAYDGGEITKIAVKLLLLTMVRTSELRYARREEINGELWRIPPERMKAGIEHIVPLSRQALRLFARMDELTGSFDLIFPNMKTPGKAMSENTVLFALYRMGYKSRATGHGFRSTASTILNEHGFNRDAIERQLAHVEGNEVRKAYNHAEYLPERRKMMQWWADYLDGVM